MKNALLLFVLLIVPFEIHAQPPTNAPAADVTGVWLVNGVHYAPWVFDLKQNGTTLTGSVWQSGAVQTVAPVTDGTVNGSELSFRITGGSGSTGGVITFRGTQSGETISFTRTAEKSGTVGDGLYGAAGATTLTANRLPPGSTPPSQPTARTGTVANNVVRLLQSSLSVTTAPGERWQVTGVPNAPWTFEFTVAGTLLTGTISQAGSPAAPVSIAGGKSDGTVISFKVLSPDGERVIAFNGRINGMVMAVEREITPLADGTRGGNDLYGELAPLQFTANRVNNVASFSMNRSPANLFTFKGMSVDVTSIQSLPNREAILESLRGQITIIDAAITDPALKAFLQSVPLAMSENPAGADNAAYTSTAKGVILTSQSYSSEKPVLLHELMHAYHDQKIPGGFSNPTIQQFYQQAKSSGKFPAGSYMLSNVQEYFAMMASVYLHGSAARDPNTRQEIKDNQPDFYQWLVTEFGPK